MSQAALPAAVAASLTAVLGLALHGCAPPPAAHPHYVLGAPYQAAGVWHYPRESFDLNETGLAVAAKDGPPRLTADGEVFDQSALAGAHATLQLPAIARLTNLENGRQVLIRINDRGSGDPRRLVEVTRRTAAVLGMSGPTRVRLEVLPVESHEAADAMPDAPQLALSPAPRSIVEVAELEPLPGTRTIMTPAAPKPPARRLAAVSPAVAPRRLPETVTQVPADPGHLVVRLDTFDEFHYAAVQQAKMAALGAHIVYLKEGRSHRFRVDIGPLPSVAQADAVLERALAIGIPDARIVVD